MRLELRFFANFREVVGRKTIEREYDDDADVGDVLCALVEEYPDLEIFTDDGEIREFLNIMKNGRNVIHLEGQGTDLEDGDTLSVFPPVAGGR